MGQLLWNLRPVCILTGETRAGYTEAAGIDIAE